jgi:hypothetical protein
MPSGPRWNERAAAWWTAPMRSRRAYALAALLGLASYVITYGFGHMIGTSSYWDLPQWDSRAYLIGYRYFLHEPWHWPLFVVHTMNVPYPKSIAFSDSIPLFALINKAIATVIPPWGDFTNRDYLGLWHAIRYAQQACFGLAILRQLGHRSRGQAIVGSLFFLAVPSWISRYPHAALSGHFVILSAFYLYLRTAPRELPTRRLLLAWLGQLVAGALVNPYHAVISFGFFLAAMLRSRRWWSLALVPCGAALVGGALWFGGYLSRDATVSLGGFDIASTNLTAMFSSRHSGIFGDMTWLASTDATGYQYEGIAYLGLGFLILLAASATQLRSVAEAIRRHPFLFAFALGAWLLALSDHVYAGSHLVVSYGYPHSLRWITEEFRSPGRFVWIPMYVLIAYLLHWGFKRFSSGWQLAVLPVLAIVQLADARGASSYEASSTHEPYAPVIALEPWRALVHSYDAVFVLPSYDCVLDGTPNIDHVSLDIEYYASERALPINGVYSARPTRDCAKDETSWGSIELADHTLYVLLPRAVRIARRLQSLGATCGKFAYGVACSKESAPIVAAVQSGALKAVTPDAPPLAYGHHVELAQPSPFLGEGWSWAEPQGRWSDGLEAGLLFRLVGDPPSGAALHVQAVAALCGRRAAQEVDVMVDDELLATLRFDSTTNDVAVVRTIPIAHPELLRRSSLELEFRPYDIRTPARLGCNDDRRALGIMIQRLWFE